MQAPKAAATAGIRGVCGLHHPLRSTIIAAPIALTWDALGCGTTGAHCIVEQCLSMRVNCKAIMFDSSLLNFATLKD